MSNICDYRVDHLLLLVGSNPLPNAVAGKLLLAPGGTITLIHSKEGFDLAQKRLQGWFDEAGYINFKTVEDESDANLVEMRVYEALDDYERKIAEEHNLDSGNAKRVRIGLNYTGGTKVMAVHAHLAVKKWLAKDSRRRDIFSGDSVFSYLDARTLRMRIDPVGGQPAISFPVGRKVDISINKLLDLHGWMLEKNLPITAPVLPQSAAALLAIHSNPNNAETWRKWLRDELFPEARKRVSIDPPIWKYKTEEKVQERLEHPAPNDDWKSSTKLQNLKISWPGLPTFRESMSNELGLNGIEYLSLTAANGKGCEKAEDFCKWLSGLWLESAVLSVLQDCAQELQFNDCAMNIKPKASDSSETNFEFDVAAIRGYQLFAFSCTTDRGKSLLKQKLFEVYVRARQMGGDEACAALICCANEQTARLLEEEVRRDIVMEGRIRVFGQEQLVDLAEHIKDWVKEQSKDS